LISPTDLAARFIPFSSLRSTTEAFIDYCLPECKPKFNYALIGPGVAQNPNQPVNLREPHGFQVGGVSMPHGKTNPAHMHFTCEVFICTKGNWRIQWGFNPDPASAEIGEGDIVSVPTWIYRGFTNVGVDDGFLFTALGGDHTGGVLWGPTTLEAAARNGVHLTDDYRMIDTTRGEVVPAGTRLFQPMSPQEIAQLRVWPAQEMLGRIVRFADLRWSTHGLLDSALPGCGAQMASVVGLGITEDRNLQAPVANAHGVSIEWLRIPPGGSVSRHSLVEKQVLIAKSGQLEVSVETTEGPVAHTLVGTQSSWDTFSLPPDSWRAMRNTGEGEALALVMTAGDHRKRIAWDASVKRAAAEAGLAHDASGFVAPKAYVDRAQP
jgi:quercetin dioxygenase-like cupin family protein